MTELELEWRPMREEDRNYVLSSWLRSYAECPEFRHLARGVYFALYEPTVKAMIERSTVAIARTTDLPDTVIGFLVIEADTIVHYVHTKRRFRRLGVASWMVRELRPFRAAFTHSPTPVASRLCGPEWKYEPLRRFRKTS